jgi:hypothetical protein
VNRNVAPGPVFAIAHNRPPCNSTIDLVMARPHPGYGEERIAGPAIARSAHLSFVAAVPEGRYDCLGGEEVCRSECDRRLERRSRDGKRSAATLQKPTSV